MIETVADLLREIVDREAAVLDKSALTHGPTIGDMYEGLTRKVLEMAVPGQVRLRVVTGFAFDDEGNTSAQLDCMVVTGDGERIPYTDSYRYRVGQVIAVVEVKKRLGADQIFDGYENLRSVSRLKPTHDLPVAPAVRRVFQFLTRSYLPDSKEERAEMTEEDRMLYALISMEAMSPACILLGYHGHKSESGLRKAALHHVAQLVGRPGHGPKHLPRLILNRHASIGKTVGFPWMRPQHSGRYGLLASSASISPIACLLDAIWTVIHLRGQLPRDAFGDDNYFELWNPLLDAVPKAVPKPTGKSALGWEYMAHNLSVPLSSEVRSPRIEWGPVEISVCESVLLAGIVRKGSVDDCATVDGIDSSLELESLLTSLTAKGLIGPEANGTGRYFLLTEELGTAFMPSGQVLASGDIVRLENWLAGQTAKKA